MLEKVKTRILQSRNEGTFFNRILNKLRVNGLKVKGIFETTRANIYFSRNRIDKENFQPDFICAGMQKSATSWLDKMLRNHPEIYLPELRKEVHFWDKFQNRGLNWYFYHFINAEPHQFRGEITPGYSIISIPEIQKIHQFNPNLRVIFLLRNPIERDWSQTYMDLIRHVNKEPDMVSMKSIINHLNSPVVETRGDYEKNLRNWYQVFPKEQIYIEYFENIISQPEQVITRILRFIGIQDVESYDQYGLHKKINANKSGTMPAEVLELLIEKYSPLLKSLYLYLSKPPEIAAWIKKYNL